MKSITHLFRRKKVDTTDGHENNDTMANVTSDRKIDSKRAKSTASLAHHVYLSMIRIDKKIGDTKPKDVEKTIITNLETLKECDEIADLKKNTKNLDKFSKDEIVYGGLTLDDFHFLANSPKMLNFLKLIDKIREKKGETQNDSEIIDEATDEISKKNDETSNIGKDVLAKHTFKMEGMNRYEVHLKKTVLFLKFLEEYEENKRVLVTDEDASFKMRLPTFIVRLFSFLTNCCFTTTKEGEKSVSKDSTFLTEVTINPRKILFFNIFYDLFFDKAPSHDQIITTVLNVGFMSALVLSLCVAFPTSVEHDELVGARDRFRAAGCGEDVVYRFGRASYYSILFNSAGVATSIIIIFINCASDFPDHNALRHWWSYARFSVALSILYAFCGTFFAMGAVWMLFRIKWPTDDAPDLLEDGSSPVGMLYDNECEDPPPIFSGDVWKQSFWFSKAIMYTTMGLVMIPMSLCIMTLEDPDDEKEQVTDLASEQKNKEKNTDQVSGAKYIEKNNNQVVTTKSSSDDNEEVHYY